MSTTWRQDRRNSPFGQPPCRRARRPWAPARGASAAPGACSGGTEAGCARGRRSGRVTAAVPDQPRLHLERSPDATAAQRRHLIPSAPDGRPARCARAQTCEGAWHQRDASHRAQMSRSAGFRRGRHAPRGAGSARRGGARRGVQVTREHLGAGCRWPRFGLRTWFVHPERAVGSPCVDRDLAALTPQPSERASATGARPPDVRRAATQRGRRGTARAPAHVGAVSQRGCSSEHGPATVAPRSAQQLDCEGAICCRTAPTAADAVCGLWGQPPA